MSETKPAQDWEGVVLHLGEVWNDHTRIAPDAVIKLPDRPISVRLGFSERLVGSAVLSALPNGDIKAAIHLSEPMPTPMLYGPAGIIRAFRAGQDGRREITDLSILSLGATLV